MKEEGQISQHGKGKYTFYILILYTKRKEVIIHFSLLILK